MPPARNSSEWVAVPFDEDNAPDLPANGHCESQFERTASAARAAAARHDFAAALALLNAFLETVPDHFAALEQLVDVCIAGGLERQLADAQTRMANACLEAGCYAEAQVIANDLALRYPDDATLRKLAARIAHVAELSGSANVAPPASRIEHRPTTPTPQFVDPPREEPAFEPDEEVEAPDPEFGDIRDRTLASLAARAAQRFADAVQSLEAGRPGAARAALEVVIAVPELRARAATRLASLLRDGGAPASAMAWLEWAAEVPPETAETGHEVAYEFAVTLEALGRRQEALGLYRELLKEVGAAYRDVAARIRLLTGAARPASGRAV